jgi:hypothetical protein
MGRHARRPQVDNDPATLGFQVPDGWVGLYPRPGELPEDVAAWVDRSWSLFRQLAMDDRLFGLMPYESEIGSKPPVDRDTGRRRGRRLF